MAQFNGFKQVLLATYEALEASAKTGYVWFVRPDSASTYGDIYVGSRHYGHFGNEAETISALQAIVGAGFSGKTLTEKIDELTGIEASGVIVYATEDNGVYTDVEEGTPGAEKYLKLTIGSGDPIYILASELVNLEGYATTADLAGKADVNHTHDQYSLTSHTHDDYAVTGHNHDDRYYTEQEVDDLLSGITSNVKADWEAQAGSDAEILNKPDLSNFATTGDVSNAVSGKAETSAVTALETAVNGKQDTISDLEQIRTNAAAGAAKQENVQADWNSTSGLSQILNKPNMELYALKDYVDTAVGSIPTPQVIEIDGDDVEE